MKVHPTSKLVLGSKQIVQKCTNEMCQFIQMNNQFTITFALVFKDLINPTLILICSQILVKFLDWNWNFPVEV